MAGRGPLVTERSHEGALLLTVTGTQFVLEAAREVVQIVFEGPPSLPREVVLDLTAVRYLNSSALSVIIRLNVERTLALAGVAEPVREILDMSGVLPFLRLAPDAAAARTLLVKK